MLDVIFYLLAFTPLGSVLLWVLAMALFSVVWVVVWFWQCSRAAAFHDKHGRWPPGW